MHCIFPPSRSLLSSMASGPPRRWLPMLARRVASVTAPLRLRSPLRQVSRFPRGSRNMTNGSGVTDEELDKPNKRHLIPSANDPIQTTKDIMISMDKHFDMHNEINRAAIQDFITHNADVRPGNIEDGSKINMYGNEDVCKRTMEVTDGKQDARLAAKEVADVEDVSDQRASEVSYDDAYEEFTDCIDNYPCDGFDYWITLERSSHRDGSIYCTRGSFGYAWKNDYRIADRNESK
nr:unnamed protein product [Digitaria exilis]